MSESCPKFSQRIFTILLNLPISNKVYWVKSYTSAHNAYHGIANISTITSQNPVKHLRWNFFAETVNGS